MNMNDTIPKTLTSFADLKTAFKSLPSTTKTSLSDTEIKPTTKHGGLHQQKPVKSVEKMSLTLYTAREAVPKGIVLIDKLLFSVGIDDAVSMASEMVDSLAHATLNSLNNCKKIANSRETTLERLFEILISRGIILNENIHEACYWTRTKRLAEMLTELPYYHNNGYLNKKREPTNSLRQAIAFSGVWNVPDQFIELGNIKKTKEKAIKDKNKLKWKQTAPDFGLLLALIAMQTVGFQTDGRPLSYALRLPIIGLRFLEWALLDLKDILENASSVQPIIGDHDDALSVVESLLACIRPAIPSQRTITARNSTNNNKHKTSIRSVSEALNSLPDDVELNFEMHLADINSNISASNHQFTTSNYNEPRENETLYPGVIWDKVEGPFNHVLDPYEEMLGIRIILIAPRIPGGLGRDISKICYISIEDYDKYFTPVI